MSRNGKVTDLKMSDGRSTGRIYANQFGTPVSADWQSPTGRVNRNNWHRRSINNGKMVEELEKQNTYPSGETMSDGYAQAKKIDPLERLFSAGLNQSKADGLANVVARMKDLKWYDRLLNTKKYKLIRAESNLTLGMEWYVPSLDERNQPQKQTYKEDKIDMEDHTWYYYDSKRYEDFIDLTTAYAQNPDLSAHLSVNKDDLKKSTWTFHMRDQVLVESTVERILGDHIEDKNVKKVCNIDFANYIFPLFASESIERVQYFLTGEQGKNEKNKEDNDFSERTHRLVGID